jgi:DNA polymerase-3 subunit beta
VELLLKDNTLHVTAGESKFELATLGHDEFPPFPRVKDPVEFKTSEFDLRRALASTAFAASTDESRYVLNGTLLQFDKQELTVVACDGRRLGCITVELDGNKKLACILPSKTVKELLRLLHNEEESPRRVQITASKANIQFTVGEITIVSKLIEGDYPDYKRVIPEANIFTPISRADLLGCVERVNLVADAATLQLGGVSLGITSFLSGEKKDLIGKAADALLVPCKQDVTLSLSTRYLMDTLKATAAEEIQLYAKADSMVRFDVPSLKWISIIAPLKAEEKKPEAKPEAKNSPTH